MPDFLMQPVIQPFVKLTQSNIDLLTKFAQSPEVASQSVDNANNLFQQAQESATNLFNSRAFAQMMQGMLKNYTEFTAELIQSGMAMVTQNQAAILQQTQEAAGNVIQASEARGRRSRQSA